MRLWSKFDVKLNVIIALFLFLFRKVKFKFGVYYDAISMSINLWMYGKESAVLLLFLNGHDMQVALNSLGLLGVAILSCIWVL